jgi:hypothetical protein
MICMIHISFWGLSSLLLHFTSRFLARFSQLIDHIFHLFKFSGLGGDGIHGRCTKQVIVKGGRECTVVVAVVHISSFPKIHETMVTVVGCIGWIVGNCYGFKIMGIVAFSLLPLL